MDEADVIAVVDIPRGGRSKYEYDEASGKIVVLGCRDVQGARLIFEAARTEYRNGSL